MNITCVIVLYKCEIENSQTINSFYRIFRNNLNSINNINIIIYDNGNNNQSLNILFPEKFNYFNSENNDGLAVAYNYAFTRAIENNSDWLLLLDQDTELPLNYFNSLIDSFGKVNTNKKIKAVVPKVYYSNNYFSPSKVLIGGILRPINMDFIGIYDREIFAIGSGSALKVDFINSIGGFNTNFWLDSLDRWIYHKINEISGEVYVTDIRIKHELSILDYDNLISIERYKNIIYYESLFMKNYKSAFENIIFHVRLLFRAINFFYNKKNKSYSLITFNFFVKSLLKNIIRR